MNDLFSKYGDQGLVVLGFPSNQFAFQENMGNGDILNLLKYIRPGGGYVPNFPLFQMMDVNGGSSDPLFKWLRNSLPLPSDDPYGMTIELQLLMLWAPASRTDIDWNFSKFLIDRNGKPLKRWTSNVSTNDPGLVADIVKALNNQSHLIEVPQIVQLPQKLDL
jgi:glutathione peroxidase